MKTCSPYTELLFCLSPSTNVTESLKTFGVDEHAKEAIAVRFTESINYSGSTDSFISELQNSLNCKVSEFSTNFCDLKLVKDVYKPSNEDRLVGEICTSIATKNI